MSAVLSPCGLYRYRLDRTIDGLLNADGPVVGFCLHNPSTADAERDDPTSRRGIGFARAWGASRLIFVNAWSYRATKPADLWRAVGSVSIVGPDNDRHILDAASECWATGGFMVAAWGAISPPAGLRSLAHARLSRCIDLIRSTRCELRALVLNADGSPKHPLYVRADAVPGVWMRPGLPSLTPSDRDPDRRPRSAGPSPIPVTEGSGSHGSGAGAVTREHRTPSIHRRPER